MARSSHGHTSISRGNDFTRTTASVLVAHDRIRSLYLALTDTMLEVTLHIYFVYGGLKHGPSNAFYQQQEPGGQNTEGFRISRRG